MRGFLQHALPKGFSKIRYYGWMASNLRTTRDRVKWLVWLHLGWSFWLGSGVAPQPDRFVSKRAPCEYCDGQLHLIAITDGTGRVLGSLPDETQLRCQVTTVRATWQVPRHSFGQASGRASALRVTALPSICVTQSFGDDIDVLDMVRLVHAEGVHTEG